MFSKITQNYDIVETETHRSGSRMLQARPSPLTIAESRVCTISCPQRGRSLCRRSCRSTSTQTGLAVYGSLIKTVGISAKSGIMWPFIIPRNSTSGISPKTVPARASLTSQTWWRGRSFRQRKMDFPLKNWRQCEYTVWRGRAWHTSV